MTTEIYKKYCSRCKKKTSQFIKLSSRKRGVKTQCLECGAIQPKWMNFKFLEEKSK